MFIEDSELKTVAYSYQLNQIVEGDSTIIKMAVEAAVEEMRGYLNSRFDVVQIFSQSGDSRNALIVEICKDIALWYIIRLANVDMIYEPIKDRYDRAIEWLNKVATRVINPDLPLAKGENGESQYPMRFGSMEKSTYDF